MDHRLEILGIIVIAVGFILTAVGIAMLYIDATTFTKTEIHSYAYLLQQIALSGMRMVYDMLFTLFGVLVLVLGLAIHDHAMNT